MTMTTATTLLRRLPLWQQLRVARRTATHLTAKRNTLLISIRGFATRSASAVVSTAKSSLPSDDSTRRTETNLRGATAHMDETTDMHVMLDKSIAERQPSQALAYYNCLESPPSVLTSQKLAILLAKQASVHQTRRAIEILQAVYGAPAFEGDDYMQLATIYTVDACLRHHMLTEALEIVNQATEKDVCLDLSAYDGLIQALVADKQIDVACKAITAIVAKRQVVLEQQTFQPLLFSMMALGQYDDIIKMIDHGRKNGVVFTMETYDPLADMVEEVDDSKDEELWNTLEKFMGYINDALDEDGMPDLSDDEDDDDDDTVALHVYEEDEDDDDDDEDFDNHEY